MGEHLNGGTEVVSQAEDRRPPVKSRFIDSGWRLTIPKVIRDYLGWDQGTPICVSWDGLNIIVKHPTLCPDCPDVVRMGSLGKVVLPPRVREEANLYRGQVMSLAVNEGRVLVSSGASQVRCQACGSEMDVKEEIANVYLCRRCRESLQKAAVKTVTWR